MKLDFKMAEKSAASGWGSWRNQFKSDEEALILLLRVINSRIKPRRRDKLDLYTRPHVPPKVARRAYFLKEVLLVLLERRGLMTSCYLEEIMGSYNCFNCRDGCVLCDGKVYIGDKILYKKVFNINNNVYSFHCFSKPLDESRIQKESREVITCNFRDVEQRSFDVHLAVDCLEKGIEKLSGDERIGKGTIAKLLQDDYTHIEYLLSENRVYDRQPPW